MMCKNEAKQMINDLFRDEALIVGGMSTFDGMKDEHVRHLMRHLDLIRLKYHRRLDKRFAGNERKGRKKKISK